MTGVSQSGYYIFDDLTDASQLNIVYCDMTLPYSIGELHTKMGSITLDKPARFIVEQNTNSTYESIVEYG